MEVLCRHPRRGAAGAARADGALAAGPRVQRAGHHEPGGAAQQHRERLSAAQGRRPADSHGAIQMRERHSCDVLACGIRNVQFIEKDTQLEYINCAFVADGVGRIGRRSGRPRQRGSRRKTRAARRVPHGYDASTPGPRSWERPVLAGHARHLQVGCWSSVILPADLSSL